MDANYYYKNKLKTPKSFEDWCYKQMPNKKRNFKLFVIVLCNIKRIEVQSYGCWKEKNKTPVLELVNMELLTQNKIIKITRNYFNEGSYMFGLTRINMFSGAYTNAIMYNNNWKEKLKEVSELKYIRLPYMFHISYLSRYYKYRKEIEFTQKINAIELCNNIMTGLGIDMRVINQNWLRKNKRYFKNSSKSFSTFKLEEEINKRNGKMVEGIDLYIEYKDVKKIPKQIGIIKAQNWIIKNKVDIQYYFDYLHLLKDLNISLDESNILPKDLEQAHDNAVNQLNALKREIELNGFKDRKLTLNKLEMEIDDYKFIIPGKAKELITEGKKLHHCVGGSNYIKDHARGKTTIIFIRKEVSKPLFTMEFKNNKIVQLRANRNDNPPKEVWEVTNKWLSEIKKIEREKKEND